MKKLCDFSNIKRKINSLIGFFFILFLIISITSCQDIRLEIPPPAAPAVPKVFPKANFCLTDPNDIKNILKVFFVVDQSGSNGNTDPDKLRRYPAIRKMVEGAIQEKDETWFGLITFNQGNPGVRSSLTDNYQSFQAVLAEEEARADGGSTPYFTTLDLLKNEVEMDIKKAIELAKRERLLEKYTYTVFFMSDGRPTDSQNIEGINNTVGDIKLLEDKEEYESYVNGITFNGIYYYAGAYDAEGAEVLKNMSNSGGGIYREFGGTDVIDLSDYEYPEFNVISILRSYYAVNLNKIWESVELTTDLDGDGLLDRSVELLKDTDGDGLSDKKEGELGSDPKQKDSDRNGVSDKVEYIVTTRPCKDPACDPEGSFNFNLLVCKDVIPQDSLNSDKVNFLDSDNDGLNDCEEIFIGTADPYNPDSTDAWFPDGLIVRTGVGFAGGQSTLSIDTDSDGSSNLEEIRKNTPWDFSNDKILGLREIKYSLEMGTYLKNVSCYNLGIEDLAADEGDEIKVMYMEGNALDENIRSVHSAKKTVEDPQKSIIFSKEDFD